MTNVALVHDYLTQRGGAERVVLAMADAFPGAPVYTSLYDPAGTFPGFGAVDVRPGPLNRVGLLRRRHRLALPLLAPAFSRLTVDAPVSICSSSGWAHGARTTGRTVVYCHTPARWLYQQERYLGEHDRGAGRAALAALAPALRRWDRKAARRADRYLVNSSVVRERVRAVYGRDAEILPPPPALTPELPRRPVDGVDAGFWLCVSRLLPYKHVDAVVAAFAALPDLRLVVVGSGPELPHVRSGAPGRVTFLERPADDELAWLYSACGAVVAASHEDFGLTPLEGAAFGRPAAVLRFGGFLDTVVDGLTGTFFDEPTPAAIADAVRRVESTTWSTAQISAHAATFGAQRFTDRLRQIAADEAAQS